MRILDNTIPVFKWNFHLRKHSLERFRERVEPVVDCNVPKPRGDRRAWIESWLRCYAAKASQSVHQWVLASCPGHTRGLYLAVRSKTFVVVAVCETTRHDSRYKSRIDCVVRTFLVFDKNGNKG